MTLGELSAANSLEEMEYISLQKTIAIVYDRSKFVWQVESRSFNVQHSIRSLSDHQPWTTSDVPASEKERAAPFTTAPWKHVFMFDLVMVQLHRSPPPPLHHISLQKTIAIVYDRSKFVWQVESRSFNVQHSIRSLSDHQPWTTSDVPASEKERAAPFTTAPWKHIYIYLLFFTHSMCF